MTQQKERLLGDRVETMLKSLGGDTVAKLIEKVGRRPCGCGGRKEKLNEWHRKMSRAIDEIKNG